MRAPLMKAVQTSFPSLDCGTPPRDFDAQVAVGLPRLQLLLAAARLAECRIA